MSAMSGDAAEKAAFLQAAKTPGWVTNFVRNKVVAKEVFDTLEASPEADQLAPKEPTGEVQHAQHEMDKVIHGAGLPSSRGNRACMHPGAGRGEVDYLLRA